MMKFVANFGLIAVPTCLFLQGCKEEKKEDHAKKVAQANEGSPAAESVQEKRLMIENSKYVFGTERYDLVYRFAYLGIMIIAFYF